MTGELSLSELRQKVGDIWYEVLDVPEGLEAATFSDLEGQFAAAARLVGRIKEELGISIDVGDVFDADPNLEALVERVALDAHVPMAV
ncbi:phosphopantetheine-binding protein [Nonomuraea sp. NPDC052265]|uniref:phosphopantetheine-binding protein n=1 Tax=Nonomuraea sp. NPDC052265 TaxID=3364374 RepID=UPI0037CBCDC7